MKIFCLVSTPNVPQNIGVCCSNLRLQGAVETTSIHKKTRIRSVQCLFCWPNKQILFFSIEMSCFSKNKFPWKQQLWLLRVMCQSKVSTLQEKISTQILVCFETSNFLSVKFAKKFRRECFSRFWNFISPKLPVFLTFKDSLSVYLIFRKQSSENQVLFFLLGSW